MPMRTELVWRAGGCCWLRPPDLPRYIEVYIYIYDAIWLAGAAAVEVVDASGILAVHRCFRSVEASSGVQACEDGGAITAQGFKIYQLPTQVHVSVKPAEHSSFRSHLPRCHTCPVEKHGHR